MGKELGSAIDIDGILVPLYTHLTLIGNDDIWSCHRDFMPKCWQKLYL